MQAAVCHGYRFKRRRGHHRSCAQRGEVVGAIDQRNGHVGNAQRARAGGEYEGHNAHINVEAKGDCGSVTADVVVSINAGGAEGRGERYACDKNSGQEKNIWNHESYTP